VEITNQLLSQQIDLMWAMMFMLGLIAGINIVNHMRLK